MVNGTIETGQCNLIYINDLVRITDDTFCYMYADDTVIVSSNVCGTVAVHDSYTLFFKISIWCTLNRIKVNRKKTKHMLVGPKTNDVVLNMNRLEK